MRCQFLRNGWTHGFHGAFGATVRTAELAPNGSLTSDTGHQNDAPMLCTICDHLSSCQLRRKV